MPVRIQTTLITDTYAATVPGAAVRTHFQQLAVLRHTSVTTDIKMISYRAETARLVVTEQLLGGVIPGGACGAAMNHDIFTEAGEAIIGPSSRVRRVRSFGASSSPIIIGKVS